MTALHIKDYVMKDYTYYNEEDKFAQLLLDLVKSYGASKACRAMLYAGANAGHRYTGLEDTDWKDPFECNLFSIAYSAHKIIDPQKYKWNKEGAVRTYDLVEKIEESSDEFKSLDDYEEIGADRLYSVLKSNTN